MNPARVKLTGKILTVIPLIAALSLLTRPALAAMGGSQYCRPGTACTIGEFLYDDNYAPITDALCLMSAYDPSDTVLFDEVEMATGSAGWYDYDFTAPTTEGYYHTQICCYTNGEKLCLDKSFNVEANEVRTAAQAAGAVWGANRTDYNSAGTFGEALQNSTASTNDIATAVWGFSGRTLTSFGTLVSDIWNNATRTLTGFGTLVSDIWNHSDRTLTDTDPTAVAEEVWTYNDRQLTSLENQTSQIWNHEDRSLTSSVHVGDQSISTITESVIATMKNQNLAVGGAAGVADDLEALKAMVAENRNLLERLVNEPVIETFIEEEVPDLSEKLEQTERIAEDLYVKTETIGGKLEVMESGYDSLGKEELLDEVAFLLATIGGDEDTLDQGTLKGQLNWLSQRWGFEVVEQIANQTDELKNQLVELESKLSGGGKSESARSLVLAMGGYEPVVASLVGKVSADLGEASLFGKIGQVRQLAAALERYDAEAQMMLGDWTEKSSEDLFERAKELAQGVAQVNQVSKIRSVFEVGVRGLLSKKELKNAVLAMRGVIQANRRLLAANPGQPLANVWLEEGSIVFRALITNPSRRISQTVPLKYYLPVEIREEDVMETDEGLAVKYDAERDQYFVEGEFTLGPGEAKTVSVRTVDIWEISAEEIESLREQVKELSRPLEGTSYFAQGVTLASDIDVALDKIIVLQQAANTPEQKIRAYREAQLEMAGVVEKLDKLKDLVTTAGSAGTLFGFVGGAQALAVWGLVIIMSVGFVFLALYMRLLRPDAGKVVDKKRKLKKIPQTRKIGYKVYKNTTSVFPWKMALPVLVIVGGAGLIILVVVGLNQRGVARETQVGTAEELNGEAEARAKGEPEDTKPSEEQAEPSVPVEAVGGLDVITIEVEKGQVVRVYEEMDTESKVVAELQENREAIRVGGVDEWVNIVIADWPEKGQVINGWVRLEFVEGGSVLGQSSKEGTVGAADKEEDVSVELSATVGETVSGWLRVRKYPKGPELTRVYSGEIYPVLDEEEGWVMIGLDDGSVGWVSGDYVRVK